MAGFSNSVENKLRLAGWFPGRQIAVTRYEEAFGLAGYRHPYWPSILPGPVRQFLSEFGDLDMVFNADELNLRLALNPVSASQSLSYSGEKLSLGEGTKQDYWPVGSLYRLNSMGKTYDIEILIIGADGRVYSTDGPTVYLIAETGPDAIESLLTAPNCYVAAYEQ